MNEKREKRIIFLINCTWFTCEIGIKRVSQETYWWGWVKISSMPHSSTIHHSRISTVSHSIFTHTWHSSFYHIQVSNSHQGWIFISLSPFTVDLINNAHIALFIIKYRSIGEFMLDHLWYFHWFVCLFLFSSTQPAKKNMMPSCCECSSGQRWRKCVS